jgi:glycosyltransferase involved in cell wall biosynthesis
MKYSVIIPIYNSEKTIGHLIDELIKYFSKKNINFEIICVNDGSIDDSWNIIKKKLNIYQGKIVAINLINNHGQQIANYCGLENSSGDYLITMDDDMQNPVSEISKLIQKSKEGYILVKQTYDIDDAWGFVKLTKKEKVNMPEEEFKATYRVVTRAITSAGKVWMDVLTDEVIKV